MAQLLTPSEHNKLKLQEKFQKDDEFIQMDIKCPSCKDAERKMFRKKNPNAIKNESQKVDYVNVFCVCGNAEHIIFDIPENEKVKGSPEII